MTEITKFYYGRREVVIAELGGMTSIYPGKYLIQPDGNDTFDAEGADTKADLALFLAELRQAYPHAEFIQL